MKLGVYARDFGTQLHVRWLARVSHMRSTKPSCRDSRGRGWRFGRFAAVMHRYRGVPLPARWRIFVHDVARRFGRRLCGCDRHELTRRARAGAGRGWSRAAKCREWCSQDAHESSAFGQRGERVSVPVQGTRPFERGPGRRSWVSLRPCRPTPQPPCWRSARAGRRTGRGSARTCGCTCRSPWDWARSADTALRPPPNP